MEEIRAAIASVCKDLFKLDIEVELTRPNEQFGDYSTNVALQIIGKLPNPPAGGPREIAEQLAKELKSDSIAKVEVAGPGFINIFLTDEVLWKVAENKPKQSLHGKTIVAEYSDPNPFKVLHAGHVYTTVIGDSIATLLEVAGGSVHRVNFGGDVGLHVGKTMWAILKRLDGEHPKKLEEITVSERTNWLAECYIEGNQAYTEDEKAKTEIIQFNKQVYQLHADQDKSSPFAQIYWTCREWSYQSFDAFYKRLGTKLEKYYPESEVAELGLKTVKEHVPKVFEESKGAVIFDGEKYGMHTRVFINSEGLPTYEAKDVGLIMKKYDDYHFDRSVVVTGNEQEQYMLVVLKAIEQFLPDLAVATTYVPHGMVKLAGGVKMSSRLGNIVSANDVLDVTTEAIKATGREPDDNTALAAIKYAFLKTRIGGDIVYDPSESVALEGNSGPYLQYAHARARSILSKSKAKAQAGESLESDERSLLRKIGEYSEVVNLATKELMPHHICTYLYELAQTFNRFYEHNRVIGDEREAIRTTLVDKYVNTLKEGLALLGIHAPEKM